MVRQGSGSGYAPEVEPKQACVEPSCAGATEGSVPPISAWSSRYERRSSKSGEAHPSEDWFRAAFERSVTAGAVADSSGRIVQVNESLCRLLDYLPAELCSTSLAEHIDPSGGAELGRLIAAGSGSWTGEVSLDRRGGQPICASVSAASMSADSSGAYWLLQFTDVSALRELEHRLEVLERAASPIGWPHDRPEILRALDAGQICVYFQPVVSISENRIVGAEALVRWHHPDQGVLVPDVFLPMAVSSGSMTEITRSVLVQSCRQVAEWKQDGTVDERFRVAVNLAAEDLADTDLPQVVREALAEAGIDGASLVLEVTEKGLVTDTAKALGVIRDLRSLGILIALDDFGTGYSSLSHLHDFPVDMVKIDRSFVRWLGGDAHASSLVSGVVSLTRSLGLTVVAEGIEEEHQLRILRRMGCELGQGYYWSRPIPSAEFQKLMTTPLFVAPPSESLRAVRPDGWALRLSRDSLISNTGNREMTTMYSDNDPITDVDRLIEISNYDLFSADVRKELDRWAEAGARQFDLPSGMVSVVLDGAQFWAGMYGVDGWRAQAQGTPVEWAFCAEVVRTGKTYVVEDAETDDLQRDNPLVSRDGQRCYAGAPLKTSAGFVLGAYCVAGNEPRAFTETELDDLMAMADEVMAVIESHRIGDEPRLFSTGS